MFLVLFVFFALFLTVITGLVVVRGPVLAFLRFLLLFFLFLLLLRGRRFQLQRQLGLAQLHQRRHVVLFRLAARAAHVQHDVLVGVDFDEVTALERQVTGVPAFFARRPRRRLFGETGELRLHRSTSALCKSVALRTHQHRRGRAFQHVIVVIAVTPAAVLQLFATASRLSNARDRTRRRVSSGFRRGIRYVDAREYVQTRRVCRSAAGPLSRVNNNNW